MPSGALLEVETQGGIAESTEAWKTARDESSAAIGSSAFRS
jgi:hypothetical protein